MHKLQPTYYFFEQLLEDDRKQFDSTLKMLNSKKAEIDKIMARYNKAVNLQGCTENLGEFFFHTGKIASKLGREFFCDK